MSVSLDQIAWFTDVLNAQAFECLFMVLGTLTCLLAKVFFLVLVDFTCSRFHISPSM